MIRSENEQHRLYRHLNYVESMFCAQVEVISMYINIFCQGYVHQIHDDQFILSSRTKENLS